MSDRLGRKKGKERMEEKIVIRYKER